jgi:glycosyltransferase involved in cell wall biosynthesis
MTVSIPRAPLVSVVMAVKNGGQLMREAIDSILNQTFTDFEFIIINDGSADNTLEILSEYKDPRIQVYSQENRGVARSANRGIALAQGKYIARQDHDDISLPTRLEKQVEYLEMHPECGLLGTAAEIWSSTGPTGRYHDHPTENTTLQIELLFDNPFVHTSCIFRREVIRRVGLYSPLREINPLDDYEFIARVAASYEVANLLERLVIYREVSGSLTSDYRVEEPRNISGYQKQKYLIVSNSIRNILNLPISDLRCNIFGSLVVLKEIKTQGVSFSDIEILCKSAFKKLTPNESPEIQEIKKRKLDNLKNKWYLRSGYARLYEKIFYLAEVSLYPYLMDKLDKLESFFYQRKLEVMSILSKIKKYFTKR